MSMSDWLYVETQYYTIGTEAHGQSWYMHDYHPSKNVITWTTKLQHAFAMEEQDAKDTLDDIVNENHRDSDQYYITEHDIEIINGMGGFIL